MKIELEHVLLRNNSNLKIFIHKNKLTSYQHLLDYCKQRNFIPCTKEQYEEAVEKPPVNEKKRLKTQDAKKVSGSASETQKPKRRYRRKKK